jgi:hypothetical protein
VPAFNLAARAQDGTSACRSGAVLSFVSFIPLFGSLALCVGAQDRHPTTSEYPGCTVSPNAQQFNTELAYLTATQNEVPRMQRTLDPVGT